MVQKSTSWTKALFVGIWTALNFCRKLFFNVIFIVIIVGIFMVASKEDQTVKVTQNSALVLTLNGSLVIEKTAIDPAEQFFQQALNEEPEDPEVLIRDIISVLDNAKQDKRISFTPLALTRVPNQSEKVPIRQRNWILLGDVFLDQLRYW